MIGQLTERKLPFIATIYKSVKKQIVSKFMLLRLFHHVENN